MAVRAMTGKGLRRLGGVMSLPRETQAVGTTVGALSARAEALARASTPDAVREEIGKAAFEAVSDLHVATDPHVTFWSHVFYAPAAGAATPLLLTECFRQQAGVAGGAPWVQHSLGEDGKVDKDCIIHSIGCFVQYVGPPLTAGLAAVTGQSIALIRDKTIIAEVPLMACCTGIYNQPDTAAAVVPGIFAGFSNAGGGYELEGHGSPFTRLQRFSLEIRPTVIGGVAASIPLNGAAIVGSGLLIHVFVDGETLQD